MARTCVLSPLPGGAMLNDRNARHQLLSDKEAAMGFEGELLDSTIPAVIDMPLSMLIDDGDLLTANDDPDVPVAEFQSSV
jgi:hypothetical protein